jgi:archaellum component FlaC
MNIDLRNISSEFEKHVEAVKIEFGISTNSKAVELCTVNYLKQLKTIEELRKLLNSKSNELQQVKNDVKSFAGALTRLNQIT